MKKRKGKFKLMSDIEIGRHIKMASCNFTIAFLVDIQKDLHNIIVDHVAKIHSENPDENLDQFTGFMGEILKEMTLMIDNKAESCYQQLKK